MVPKEELAWLPKRVPVKEAEARTLRRPVVETRSPVMNLFVGEAEDEEDWITEELEPVGAEDEEDGNELDDWVAEDDEDKGRVPTVVAERTRWPKSRVVL